MKPTLLTTLLLAMLAGCGVRPPIEGRADPFDRKQIHFDSETLRKDTAVGTPILNHNESGLLIATIPIRSAINKTLYIDYRITYMDSNGAVLTRFGPFSKTLLPNTPDQIQLTATDPKAADFQVDFYYSR